MSIANEITRLQNAKTSIKTSIENKGVTVGDGTLNTYASKIDAIKTGITPTGTINITENGTYDVTDKASADVNVNANVSEYFDSNIHSGASSNIFRSNYSDHRNITYFCDRGTGIASNTSCQYSIFFSMTQRTNDVGGCS